MTIDGAPWTGEEDRVTLTRLPHPGSVLIGSPEPPAVLDDRCIDVRPGPSATFDGDRVRMALQVVRERDRFSFDRSELSRLEDAILASLPGDETTTVRFGDRAVCRQVLSAPAVDAIERRLLSATRRGRATLVTWTGDGPGRSDYRTYEVVVDGPAVDLG